MPIKIASYATKTKCFLYLQSREESSFLLCREWKDINSKIKLKKTEKRKKEKKFFVGAYSSNMFET